MKRRYELILAALLVTPALAPCRAAPVSASARTLATSPVRADVVLEGGRKLSYLHWPATRADRPVMLLLHGKGGFASSFEDLAAHLAGRYDLYAIDMRGRGFSDWAKDGDYTAESTISDVAGFVNLMGWHRLAVYGHSYGAVIALGYASAHPDLVGKLVLEDGGPTHLPGGAPPRKLNPGQQAIAGTPEAPRAALRFPDWPAARAWQRKTCAFTCTELLLENRLVRSVRGVIERNDEVGIAASPRGAAFADQWPAVRALAVPTLLLRAERGLVPLDIAESMAAANPQITFASITGGAHALRASRPTATFAALDRFLKD